MTKVTYEVSLMGKKNTIESWVVEKSDCESAPKMNGRDDWCEGVNDPSTGYIASDCRSCWSYAFRKDYGDEEEKGEFE